MITSRIFIEELFKVFDALLKPIDSKENILLSDTEFSKESLEFFKDNQKLRSAIVLYLYKKAPPIFEMKEFSESESDSTKKFSESINLIYRLHKKVGDIVSQSNVYETIQVEIMSRCLDIIEELLWLSLREQLEIRGIESQINTLESKVMGISNYVSKMEELKKQIDSDSEESKKVLEEIKDELRNQKIDALSMTILVFTAFTFLTVNAGVISGISQIDIINIREMIFLFLIANIVVLLGISWIMRLLKNIVRNK